MEITGQENLKQLVEQSGAILITSHISPDPDAISSVLLLSETLRANFKDKKIVAVMEEKPSQDLAFLQGYRNISFQLIEKAVRSELPQLLIIVDANSFKRVSRESGEEIRTLVNQNSIKTVVIDHHEPQDKDETDIYINGGCPATVQEIYSLLFDEFKLSKPAGYEEITLLGILSDTNRFRYKNPRHRETFALVSDLIDAGADIEKLEARLDSYSLEQVQVFGELINNLISDKGFNYSFIDDAFMTEWQNQSKSMDEFHGGIDMFVNNYIRNVEPNTWGFIVYKDPMFERPTYHISFRAQNGSQDVSAVARGLGGGGHKPAAGAVIEAPSLQEAISKIKAAIEKTANS
jgi:phosphoesterase RecJ-like protein